MQNVETDTIVFYKVFKGIKCSPLRRSHLRLAPLILDVANPDNYAPKPLTDYKSGDVKPIRLVRKIRLTRSLVNVVISGNIAEISMRWADRW